MGRLGLVACFLRCCFGSMCYNSRGQRVYHSRWGESYEKMTIALDGYCAIVVPA